MNQIFQKHINNIFISRLSVTWDNVHVRFRSRDNVHVRRRLEDNVNYRIGNCCCLLTYCSRTIVLRKPLVNVCGRPRINDVQKWFQIPLAFLSTAEDGSISNHFVTIFYCNIAKKLNKMWFLTSHPPRCDIVCIIKKISIFFCSTSLYAWRWLMKIIRIEKRAFGSYFLTSSFLLQFSWFLCMLSNKINILSCVLNIYNDTTLWKTI